jgi:collagenase-like PrtC family protease
MLLSVGYPVINVPWFKNVVKRHAEHIGEVYFSWHDMSSGRMAVSDKIQSRMEEDLSEFNTMNIKLSLLINGNCYGAEAVSKTFSDKIIAIISEINEKYGKLDGVTTTSPFAACVVKNNFPDIEVKASINMRIGTIEGMLYLKDNFDGFYVQREYNRNLEHLHKLKKWADDNNKKLYGLLNSGCLNFCSNQTFHDNLVAHEEELAQGITLPGFHPVICHKFYSNPENCKDFLKYTNWIHPEDLDLYTNIFSMGKLATRMSTDVEKVVNAYAMKCFDGNISDLLEPRIQNQR